MNHTLNSLKQISKDYDIPLNKVKIISKKHSGLALYDALEQYLLDRRRR